MSSFLFDRVSHMLASPFLRAMSPEAAHEAAMKALELGVYGRPNRDITDSSELTQTLWGLTFRNPLGIAAGFDKDARVPTAMLEMGMGFAEVGTVTPKPQAGNPKPRIFRLQQYGGVINRLGFNNRGHEYAFEKLNARVGGGVVGVNIGANKDSDDRVADYVLGVERFAALASYFTVNISSPNTPGLRDLQAPKALDELLERVMDARDRIAETGRRIPVLVKLSPDNAEEDLPSIVETLMVRKVDGVIVSNTTLARDRVQGSRWKDEAGGLSGRPLFNRSTRVLARTYQLTDGKVPLVGVGGIHDGASAVQKIRAGASLLQVYTGLIYKGPALICEVCEALSAAAKAENVMSISDLVGRDAREWAELK